MKVFSNFTTVKGTPLYGVLNELNDIMNPTGEGRVHRLSLGSLLYGLSLFRDVVLMNRSMTEHKVLNPVKSRKWAFSDLLTRHEPKLKLYGNFKLCKGQGISQLSLGGRGLTCFTDPLTTVFLNTASTSNLTLSK